MKLRASYLVLYSIGDRGMWCCASNSQCPRLLRFRYACIGRSPRQKSGPPFPRHQKQAEIVSGRSVSSIGLFGSALHRPLALILLMRATGLKPITAESPLPSLHAWEDLNRGVSALMLRLAIVSQVVDVAGAVFVSFVGLAVRVIA